MGRSKVVGLHENWVNKYKMESRRIRWETPQCRKTLEEKLHKFAAREVEKALRPLACVDMEDRLDTFVSYSLFSLVPIIGNAVCSWFDEREFTSKLRKQIGLHGKGSSTDNYIFCYATGGAYEGFKIAEAVCDDSADDFFEEILGEIIPFFKAINRTANLKFTRLKFVEAAIERGTLLHCHWISSLLDDILLAG